MSEPPTLSRANIVAGSGTYPGGDALEDLANAGLTHSDHQGTRHPQLAEAVPSIENGLWRLLPDGRMETTWRIRPEARWHDGTPFTSADLLFTAELSQDRDLPTFKAPEYNVIDGIEAPDARTLVIRWKQAYVRADEVFLTTRPKHILDEAYREAKASVLSHPYWTEQYVGTGPYQVREWAPGSHVILTAFDGYVLGRPKIDEIKVKFISDPKALMANILAGEVDLTMGRNISLQQAEQIREQWRDGTIGIGYANWIALYPQFINPAQPLLANVQFRRALAHAVDREKLVDTLQYSRSPVAHSFVNPSEAIYKDIESNVARYDYDVRRATQLIEGLGYTKGSDSPFRDAAGQPLALDVWTSGGDDAHEAGVLVVSDELRNLGIATEPFFVPQARRSDLEYNQSFPGIRLWRKDNSLWAVQRWHSRETPLPESRFVGTNDSRYMNPALDTLIDRYFATIPHRERTAVLGQIIQHVTDQVTLVGLWYNTEPQVISNRLQGRTVTQTAGGNDAWNAEAWTVSP